MAENDVYRVRFNNNHYELTSKQVDELVLVKEFLSSSYELIFRMKDKRIITGKVLSFTGDNPLHPFDIYIPLDFKIQTLEKVEEISFLDVEHIQISYQKNP